MLEDYSLATLPALEVLHLHTNKLTNLHNETFNETYNIKLLTIYNNSLKEIPGQDDDDDDDDDDYFPMLPCKN